MSINNAARLKVAGGIAKGRRLESPDVFLRPMMAKVGMDNQRVAVGGKRGIFFPCVLQSRERGFVTRRD